MHSRLGASAMKIRKACSGSYALSKIALDPDDSVSSAEGTATHWVAEQCLINPMWSPIDFVETYAENGVYLRESLLDAPTEYVNHVRDTLRQLGATTSDGKAEQHVDLSWVDAEMFGTSDYMYYHELTRTGYAWDYKNGYTDVEAVDNPQLAFYLLDFYQRGAERFVGFISQPNAGGIKRHEWTRAEMTQWIAEFRRIAAECRSEKPTRFAGAHCQHCNAKAICPENRAEAWSLYGRFGKVQHPEPSDMADELDALDAAIATMRARRETLSLYAYNDAYNNGVNIPRYKLVESTAQRKWIDEEQVIATCEMHGVDPYEKKVLTPAKLSRIFDTSALTFKPEGKPKLVKQSQRGTPVANRLVNRFSNAQGGTPNG